MLPSKAHLPQQRHVFIPAGLFLFLLWHLLAPNVPFFLLLCSSVELTQPRDGSHLLQMPQKASGGLGTVCGACPEPQKMGTLLWDPRAAGTPAMAACCSWACCAEPETQECKAGAPGWSFHVFFQVKLHLENVSGRLRGLFVL